MRTGTRLSAETPPGSTGWRADPAAGRWIFNDPLATAANGITRVVLRERSRRPGVFVFRIDARHPLAAPQPVSLPVQFAIGIGRTSAVCATTAFAPSSCRSGTRGAACS